MTVQSCYFATIDERNRWKYPCYGMDQTKAKCSNRFHSTKAHMSRRSLFWKALEYVVYPTFAVVCFEMKNAAVIIPVNGQHRDKGDRNDVNLDNSIHPHFVE